MPFSRGYHHKESALHLAPVGTVLLAFAASSCSVAPPLPATPPPPHPMPPPPLLSPHGPETLRLVESNRDAARVLASLRSRQLILTAADVSRVELLAGAPGYAWRVGPDWLHVHVYHDAPAAAAAASRFVSTAMARSQIIDWVAPPRLFQCGSALALYLGRSPQALTVLTDQCGQPVWTR